MYDPTVDQDPDDAQDPLLAPRATPGAIAAMAKAVAEDPAAGRLLESIPLPALALSPSRQVVACNRLLLEALGITPRQAIGHRPGELLRCVNASTARAGCGSAAACRRCGAVAAILGCQREGLATSGRCRLAVTTLGHHRQIDLEIAATPMESGRLRLTLFTLRLTGIDPRR